MDSTAEAKTHAVHDEDQVAPNGLVDARDLEKSNQDELEGKENPSLRLDKHGLPLMPQPTSYKDDPLVSPNRANEVSTLCF
jgi:hypothetical protein